jgi:3-methyladenine DNA glycosylase AlkD
LLVTVLDHRETARRIEAQLARVGTRERAAGEKRYLKSDLEFLGVPLGDMRRIAKPIASDDRFAREDLLALTGELWTKPVFERRMMAVVLLELNASRLSAKDLPSIERWIRESRTWALVDGLAANVVGTMALGHKLKRELDLWARDEDFWIRRSSLLAELRPLRAGAAFGPFAARADVMLEETEFFIRKAIGWVLREMSKKRPEEVFEWLAPRAHRASGVTMREAVKYLDPERGAQLMNTYKKGRASRALRSE